MQLPEQWYYMDGTEMRGPVLTSELTRLLESRRVPASTLVAGAGWQQWQPASIVFESLSLPPPPPAATPLRAVALKCIAGPDAGKLYTIGIDTVVLGRATGAGLSDAGVGAEH